MRSLGDQIAIKDDRVRALDEELYNLLLNVPNLPLPDVPVGPDEGHNIVTKTVDVPQSQSISRFDRIGKRPRSSGSSTSSGA